MYILKRTEEYFVGFNTKKGKVQLSKNEDDAHRFKNRADGIYIKTQLNDNNKLDLFELYEVSV